MKHRNAFAILITALSLGGAGISYQYAQHSHQHLMRLQTTHQRLTQAVKQAKQAKPVTTRAVPVDGTVKQMAAAGNAVLQAAPVIAQQRLQNPLHFRSDPKYQHAYGVMSKYVSDAPAWNPVATPWITMFPLQGSFVYGPLNSANLRECAWIFKHNNQPVVVVTADYAPNSNQFINAQLYQANEQTMQAQWDNHNNANSSSSSSSSSASHSSSASSSSSSTSSASSH